MSRATQFEVPAGSGQVPIPFSVVEFDESSPNNNMFDAADPTRLTARVAGKFQISGAIMWSGPDGGTFRNVGIRLNGATGTYLALLSDSPIPSGGGQVLSTLAKLIVGDYVELVVEHNDPAGLIVLKPDPPFTGASPEFMMVKV